MLATERVAILRVWRYASGAIGISIAIAPEMPYSGIKDD